MTSAGKKSPRILIVTPEVTYLPEGMGNMSDFSAKAGGLADVSAALISCLFDLGADVHVALPDYRSIFDGYLPKLFNRDLERITKRIEDKRIHLAEDRIFYYLQHVYSGYSRKDIHVSLAFQREVINNIIPRVQPDIIHCNDWMTGLIPAMARIALKIRTIRPQIISRLIIRCPPRQVRYFLLQSALPPRRFQNKDTEPPGPCNRQYG